MALRHPNRERAESQATRAVIVLLLLASGGLAAIVTFAGWSLLEGIKPLAVVAIVIYAILALYAARWSRGALAFSAGLAVLLGIVAATAAPAWFARAKSGFIDPSLPASMLGTLTVALAITQGLLLIFALRGFRQNWHVEIEVGEDGDQTGQQATQGHPGTRYGRGDRTTRGAVPRSGA